MKSRPATPNRTTSEICDFSLHCSVLNELLFYFCKQWFFIDMMTLLLMMKVNYGTYAVNGCLQQLYI